MKQFSLGTILLSLAPIAALAQTPSVTMAPKLPSGVDLHILAQSGQIEQFGLPTQAESGLPAADYNAMLSRLQDMQQVAPTFHNDFHGHTNLHAGFPKGLKQIDATTYGSNNWSDWVWTVTPGTIGSSIYYQSMVPEATPPSIGCDSSPDGLCFGGDWLGMGGFSDCNLGQIGVFYATDSAGDAILPSAFYEEIGSCTNPAPAVFFGTMAGLTDSYEPMMWRTTGRDNFLFIDYTTNQFYNFGFANNGVRGSLEIIREAVTLNGQIAVEPNGTSVFTNQHVYSPNFQSCASGNQIDMVSPYTGKVIVTPSCSGTTSTAQANY